MQNLHANFRMKKVHAELQHAELACKTSPPVKAFYLKKKKILDILAIITSVFLEIAPFLPSSLSSFSPLP